MCSWNIAQQYPRLFKRSSWSFGMDLETIETRWWTTHGSVVHVAGFPENKHRAVGKHFENSQCLQHQHLSWQSSGYQYSKLKVLALKMTGVIVRRKAVTNNNSVVTLWLKYLWSLILKRSQHSSELGQWVRWNVHVSLVMGMKCYTSTTSLWRKQQFKATYGCLLELGTL